MVLYTEAFPEVWPEDDADIEEGYNFYIESADFKQVAVSMNV